MNPLENRAKEQSTPEATDDTQRVLLLTTPHTYRAEAFRAAALKLGIEVITAIMGHAKPSHNSLRT